MVGTEKTEQDGREALAKEMGQSHTPSGSVAGREGAEVRTALPGAGAQRGPASSSKPSPKVDPTEFSEGTSPAVRTGSPTSPGSVPPSHSAAVYGNRETGPTQGVYSAWVLTAVSTPAPSACQGSALREGDGDLGLEPHPGG